MSASDPRVILYHYNPTLPGAIVLAALFTLVTLYLIIQLFRYGAWFTLPLVTGGILEIAAYVCRSLSHNNTQSLGPFIIASIFTLVAPALFAATIYMILGRIIRLLDAASLSPVRVTLLTKIFVLGDVFSFAVQSVGAQMQTGNDVDKQKFGQELIIGALFLQIFIFGLFVVVAGVFNWRIARNPTQPAEGAPWRKHMGALYAASGLILLRNAVRTIEYIQGSDGYIVVHEVFLYGFDAAPMFFVLFIMALVYAPAFLRPLKSNSEEVEMQRLGSGADAVSEDA
ncbi:MAG: hypothetical protein Q9195_005647 [Heterodermia aff. obscurata]